MALPILDGNQSATTLSTILTGGAHIPAHTVVSLGSQAISDITSAVSGISVSIGGTQTTTFGAVTGSVSVLNFPSTQTVAGTVTANAGNVSSLVGGGYENLVDLFANENIGIKEPAFVTQIAGTVTANVPNLAIKAAGDEASVFNVQVGGVDINGYCYPIPVSDSGISVPISGTVTIGAMPNGALTTRFGSVTTANTAQITSAVTNTSRKYLLAQNISAGTVTIGIGFSPTTTQGIQLTAGGGLTFDAFCPTGAVYWLGAVTGAAYTILEG